MILGCNRGDQWYETYAIPHDAADALPCDTVVMPIRGYRAWRFDPDTLELRSVTMKSRWPPGMPLEAECRAGDGRMDGPCAWTQCMGRCGAGIQAVSELRFLEQLNDLDSHIFGVVALWGFILECERGYRAQFAYPERIFDTLPICQLIAELYGVPLVPFPPN